MLFAAALVSATLTLAPATCRRSRSPIPAASMRPAGRRPRQRDWSVAALGATRAINTAQATYSSRNNKKYATRQELAGYIDTARYNLIEDADIVPGFKLTLDTSEKGYWFEIADQTDLCGFRYISNQKGLIFVAQPIR